MTPTFLLAQIAKTPIVFPSPNGIIIDRVKDVQVDLFRGVPNLSFDLHEMQGKSLGESIRIFYEAGGVRPDDHPGPVGSNFKLSVGGFISRSVQGYPDELNNSVCGEMGFYFTGGTISNSDWHSTENLKKYCKINFPDLWGKKWEEWSTELKAALIDTESDVYFFSVAGLSGRFYFDENRQIKVQCDRKVNVIFNPNDLVDNPMKNFVTVHTDASLYSKTFGKFTIIDENGTKYIFGNDAIEYSDELLGVMPRNPIVGPATWKKNRGFFCFATSWYLKEIISCDNTEAISYSYNRGAFIADFRTSISYSKTSQSVFTAEWGGVAGNGKIISPVYLKSINFEQQHFKIDFQYSKSIQLGHNKNIIANIIRYPNIKTYQGFGSEETVADILNFTNGLDFFGSQIPNADNFYDKLDRLVWPKLDKIIH
jgi:hypothetical protein